MPFVRFLYCWLGDKASQGDAHVVINTNPEGGFDKYVLARLFLFFSFGDRGWDGTKLRSDNRSSGANANALAIDDGMSTPLFRRRP